MPTARSHSATNLPTSFFAAEASATVPSYGRKRSTTLTSPAPDPSRVIRAATTHIPPPFYLGLKAAPASPATTSITTTAHIRVPHSVYWLQSESHCYRDPSVRRRHEALLGAQREVARQVVRSGSGVWEADWKDRVAVGEEDGSDEGNGRSMLGAARGFVLELEGEEGHFAPRGTLVGPAAWGGLGRGTREIGEEEVAARLEDWMEGVGEVMSQGVAPSDNQVARVGDEEEEDESTRSHVTETGVDDDETSIFFTPQNGEADSQRERSEAPSVSRSARTVSLSPDRSSPSEQPPDLAITPDDQSPEPQTPPAAHSELQPKDSDEPLSIHYSNRTRFATMPTELDDPDLLPSNPMMAEDHDLDLEALSAQLSDLASIAREDEDECPPLTHFPSRRRSSAPHGLWSPNPPPPPHPHRNHARTPSPSTVPGEEDPDAVGIAVLGVRHQRSLSLPLSPHHRQLSNLTAEEARFRRHRDSFELARHRLRHPDLQLQYEEHYPHYRVDLTGVGGAVTGSGTLAMAVPEGGGFSRRVSGEYVGGMGGLETIWDASPPRDGGGDCEGRRRGEEDVESRG